MIWQYLLIVGGLALTAISWWKIGQKKFYEDTPWLYPLSIYVWGDALVIGLFWAAVGVLASWLSWMWLVRLLLLFYGMRWFFETIYWLNHQAHEKTFIPWFLQKRKWLTADQAAIVYQVLHLCMTTLAWFGLIFSFFAWPV